MKKLIFSFAMLSLVFATSCNNDDDGDNNDPVCQTCSVEILGVTSVSEVCDNMDGTVSITSDGQTQTQTLEEGQTFAQIIASFELLGTCN